MVNLKFESSVEIWSNWYANKFGTTLDRFLDPPWAVTGLRALNFFNVFSFLLIASEILVVLSKLLVYSGVAKSFFCALSFSKRSTKVVLFLLSEIVSFYVLNIRLRSVAVCPAPVTLPDYIEVKFCCFYNLEWIFCTIYDSLFILSNPSKS